MKRIIVTLILSFFFSAGLFASPFDVLTNALVAQLNSVLSNAMNPISSVTAQYMGFYTGDGNVTPVDTSGDFSVKFGAGFGVNITPILYQVLNGQNVFTNSSPNAMDSMFNNLGSAFGAMPYPYDEAYFKIGLPGMPMDIGVRLGIIPATSIATGTGSTLSFNEFHIGAESRYVVWNLLDLVKVDWRLSADYDAGDISYSYSGSGQVNTNGYNIGNDSYNVAFAYQWGGVSIGTKLMGGLNIPFIGGPYAGVGFNLNFGSVTTSIVSSNDQFTSTVTGATGTVTLPTLSGSSSAGYNLFDIRLIAGFKLFFINLGYEYGVLNGDFDYSASLAFAF
jgi:hypothetical protein